MGLNLNSLNITLDKFNAVASGKYNIGQIKLGADGTSVSRVNNHKTWTIFNNTEISQEEAIAVKNAFCKALAKEGLSPDDIANVKKQLGIDGKAIDIIKAGSIKPLTAAEIRQVIDQYAETINRNRGSEGAAKLKTSTELYKGVSEQTLKSRETTRNKVNSQTAESMVSKADNSVNTVLDIFQYTGEGETQTISSIQKGIATEISDILKKTEELPDKKNPIMLESALAALHEDDEAKVVVTFMLDGGNVFSVNTGLGREEILTQMDKVLKVPIGSAGETESEESKISESKVKNGKVENKGAENVKKQQPKLSAGQKQIIKDLEDALELMDPNDRSGFNVKVEYEKTNVINDELRQLEKVRRKLERNPNPKIKIPTSSQLLESDKFQARVALKAKDNVRSDVIKSIVEPIQKELDKVRGLGLENVKLVNKVRAALSGDTSIDRKELIEEIKLAFVAKVVNPADKIMEEIEQGIEDNLDENFNINAWLGN